MVNGYEDFIRKYPKEDFILLLKDLGKTVKEIAKDLGICDVTLYEYCRKMGISTKAVRGRPKLDFNVSKEVLESLYSQMPDKEIAVLYNVCEDTVRIRRREHGIKNKFVAHPNLIEGYFDDIDTKEKAYWLGFVFADGTIWGNKAGYMTFGFGLSPKDSEMVYMFARDIGVDSNKVKSSGHLIRFTVSNMNFVRNLMKHGCLRRKSHKEMNFPKLGNRKLDLAFLLGYYDGDGTKGTSCVVYSSSKVFLNEIKEKFDIKCNIVENRGGPNCHSICIEVHIAYEMFENYKRSMRRKRREWNPQRTRQLELGYKWKLKDRDTAIAL